MKKCLVYLLILCFTFSSLPCAGAFETAAHSAALMEAKTGALLFCRNENERREMASTTKIMTAVLVLERGDLEQVCTLTAAQAQTEGSALGFHGAEKITVRNLLYALMLVSGNDAAVALAEICAGSQENFVHMMNEKAKSLGLKNTHFANASGLPDKAHYSTARDMALLTRYALSVKGFEALCSCAEKEIAFLSPCKTVTLHNHNRLLREYDGCIGVKTGYTERAGRCLVSAARRNGMTLIAVTLSDTEDWRDHKAMLDAGFQNCVKVQPDLTKQVPIVGGEKRFVTPACENINLVLPESLSEQVQTVICAAHFCYAPVKKGEKIGEVRLCYHKEVIAVLALYAAEDVQRMKISKESNRKLWQIWK